MNEAVNAGLTIYQASGLVGVLLVATFVSHYFMAKFFIGLIGRLSDRLDKITSEDRDKMLKCIDINSNSNFAVVTACSAVSKDVSTMSRVLTERLPRVKTFNTPLPGEQ